MSWETRREWDDDTFQRMGTKFTFGDIRFIRWVLDRGLADRGELAKWYRDSPLGMSKIASRVRGVAVGEEGPHDRPNIEVLKTWAANGFQQPMPRRPENVRLDVGW